MWPALRAEDFVRDLLASPSELSAAGGNLLSPDEQALLLRSSKELWTELDAALVDEAFEPLGPLRRAPRRREPDVDEEEDWLIERMLDDLQETEPIIRAQRGLFAERYKEQRRSLEEPSGAKRTARDRFGYVIVDEGQGLAPMQWRMIARRCPSGRMTVLGDLGQAGATAPASWDEVGTHVGTAKVSVVDLTINYRTPTQIMDLAARVLAAAAPGVAPPQSVRGTDARPVFERASRETLAEVAVQAATDAKRTVGDGKVAIITAPSLVEPVAAHLGIDLSRLDASALLDAPITVLATDDARGLEFDAVVVADPQAIIGESNGGLRALYVALTRSTQLLTVVPVDLSDELGRLLSV
jgi:superfamily I DNA/RNA helicase